jgi:hypothetical protein
MAAAKHTQFVHSNTFTWHVAAAEEKSAVSWMHAGTLRRVFFSNVKLDLSRKISYLYLLSVMYGLMYVSCYFQRRTIEC